MMVRLAASASSARWLQLGRRAWSAATRPLVVTKQHSTAPPQFQKIFTGSAALYTTGADLTLPTFLRSTASSRASLPAHQCTGQACHRTSSVAWLSTALESSSPPFSPSPPTSSRYSSSTAQHNDPVVAALLGVVPSLIAAKQPLVLCGPSGVGKSYVLSHLCNTLPDLVALSISHTSRQPRGTERDGVEYHFVEKDELRAMADQGQMIEYDDIHGNLYGTSVAAVQAVHAGGRVCVMDMTVQGAVQFVEACSVWQYGLGLPAPYCVHLKPPSLEELRSRLKHRGTESPEQLRVRIDNAQAELDDAAKAGIWDQELIKVWT